MNLQKIKQILEDTKSGVIHHPEVYEEAVEYLEGFIASDREHELVEEIQDKSVFEVFDNPEFQENLRAFNKIMFELIELKRPSGGIVFSGNQSCESIIQPSDRAKFEERLKELLPDENDKPINEVTNKPKEQ